MPTYEYFCQACGTQSDISHRISDPPATLCPACGKPALTKQISAPAFRLKGGGWYETDFKSEGKRNLAGDGEAPAKAPETKAEPAAKPAEAKPAESKPAETKPAAPAPTPSASS